MPPAKAKPLTKRAKTDNAHSPGATANTKSKAKAKTSSKVPAQRSRLVGRLANLMTVPVDVFTEICFHLFPIDLLHLAWSSKRLRSILMSKSARSIWRGARESQLPSLPPCPDDLSEPQYIALLFTTICQSCGAIRAQRTHFRLRTRHCVSCYKNCVGTSLYMHNKYGNSVIRLADAMPRDFSVAARGYIYNLAALEKCYSEYDALGDELNQAKFIQALCEKSSIEEKHNRKVSLWLHDRSQIKSRQSEDVAINRWKCIQQKLADLGWERGDFPFSNDNEWFKLTRKRQALTEKVWKNLYPKLESKLNAQRAVRIAEEKASRRAKRSKKIEALYLDYKNHNHDKDLFYPAEDQIFSVTSIKNLMEDDEAGDTTTAQWEACIPELEDAIRRGTEIAIREVRTWYKTNCSIEEDEDTDDSNSKHATTPPAKNTLSLEPEFPDMSLVTSAFKCSRCQEALWLSTFHQHEHFVTLYKWDPNGIQTPADLSSCRFLGPGTAYYDSNVKNTVFILLAFSDLNPLTAKVDDVVTKHGELYACGRCDDNHQEPVTFGKIVSHYMSEASWYEIFKKIKGNSKYTHKHGLGVEEGLALTPLYRVLSQEKARTLRINYRALMSFFDEKRELPGYDFNDYWSGLSPEKKMCNHCHFISKGEDAIGLMVNHLKAKHDIEVDTDALDEIFEDEDDYPYPSLTYFHGDPHLEYNSDLDDDPPTGHYEEYDILDDDDAHEYFGSEEGWL